jgi:hypothetical protein
MPDDKPASARRALYAIASRLAAVALGALLNLFILAALGYLAGALYVWVRFFFRAGARLLQ